MSDPSAPRIGYLSDMRVARPALLLVVGCHSAAPASQGASPSASSAGHPSHAPAAERAAPPPDGPNRCPLAANFETLRVPVTKSAVTQTGLEVTFAGISHDDHDDGRFDDIASFRFRRGAEHDERLLSLREPHTTDDVLGHCWRLVQADARAAQIAVTPRPTVATAVRHLGGGRCEPMPREHAACVAGEGYCVLSWGRPGGWSSALWCRGERWVIENERNLSE
jgi:hypothetical protein